MVKKILDVPVPSSAPGLKRPGKAKSKQATSRHRMRYSEMISSAVQALRKPRGSSRQAITKYLQNNFDVPVTSVSRNVTKNLKQMISNEQLLVASGVGAAGRFKLKKKAAASQTVTGSSKKRRVKKPASPKKKRVVKKTSKKKTPVKRNAKRTGKKPSKSGKRTGKKKPIKKSKK